jgi:hypothetical protein
MQNAGIRHQLSSGIHGRKKGMVAAFGAATILLFCILLGSCRPATDLDAERKRTVLDSITLDSLYRAYLQIKPVRLDFEAEYPWIEKKVYTVEFANLSDTLFIPLNNLHLAKGDQGFTLFTGGSYVLPPAGQPGSTRTFTIEFTPVAEGIYYDTIYLNAWKSKFVPLRAMVVTGTRVWVEPTTLGSFPFGEYRDTVVRIINAGTEKATVIDASFTSGDIGQFEIINTTFPIEIDSGSTGEIRIRTSSTQLGTANKAVLKASISYAGQGKVRDQAIVQSSVYAIPRVYVTDINLGLISYDKPYDAMCTIVNNTDSACYIQRFPSLLENDTVSVFFNGKNGGYWLSAGTAITYNVRITPRKRQPIDLRFSIPVINAVNPKKECRIQASPL